MATADKCNGIIPPDGADAFNYTNLMEVNIQLSSNFAYTTNFLNSTVSLNIRVNVLLYLIANQKD